MSNIITQKPFLIRGSVMHHRTFPKKNRFNYRASYISFPISRLNELKNPLFSLEKFNIFSFHVGDYGDKNIDKNAQKTSASIEDVIYPVLSENGIKGVKEVVLVTHPRSLGYAFNPVSFWLCFDEKCRLIAVLNEVNNTFGQRHTYLCFKDDLSEIKPNEWLSSKKVFHVSPFMDVEGGYQFRYDVTSEKMEFVINYVVDGKLKLATSLKCELQKFNTANILVRFLRMPLFTFKTIVLIHYQALKLYFKKIKFYKCPPVLKNYLTVSKKEVIKKNK